MPARALPGVIAHTLAYGTEQRVRASNLFRNKSTISVIYGYHIQLSR